MAMAVQRARISRSRATRIVETDCLAIESCLHAAATVADTVRRALAWNDVCRLATSVDALATAADAALEGISRLRTS